MIAISEKLRDISSLNSPSGEESSMRNFLKDKLLPYTDNIEEDVLGNLIVHKHAKKMNAAKTLMIVAHMDEVALMVSYIEEKGVIGVTNAGGIDANIMRGHHVCILHDGKEIRGVIGAYPFHMIKEMTKKDAEFSDLWVDIGASSKDEAEKIVTIGDYVLVDSSYHELANECVSAKACDNKAGVAVLWDVIEKISSNSIDCNVVAVFSVQEEVGLRGAKVASHAIRPDICIALDVAHASDYPGVDMHKYGDIHLGNGPIIPSGSNFTLSIQKRLMHLAQECQIPFQRLALPASSGTDINAVQTTGNGCQTGLLSIPCRYMHSPVEVISLKDVESCSNLLYKIILTVS